MLTLKDFKLKILILIFFNELKFYFISFNELKFNFIKNFKVTIFIFNEFNAKF